MDEMGDSMGQFATLEEAIEVASRMKECLVTVYTGYEKLPKLIEAEHVAIQGSDLDECERLAREKLVIGEEIDAAFNALNGRAQQLISIQEKISGRTSSGAANVSECIAVFEEISLHFQEVGFGSQVFDHVLAGFKDVFAQFLKLRKETIPLMETNRYVVSRMLANRQENLQFWQEVAAEALASYTDRGKQKPSKGKSIISVKA